MDFQALKYFFCAILFSFLYKTWAMDDQMLISRKDNDILVLPKSHCAARVLFCSYLHADVYQDCSCQCPSQRRTFYEPNWTCTPDSRIHLWEGIKSPFQDKRILRVLAAKTVQIKVPRSQDLDKCQIHTTRGKYLMCNGSWATIGESYFKQIFVFYNNWRSSALTIKLNSLTGSRHDQLRLIQGRIVKLKARCIFRRPHWISSKYFNLLFKIEGRSECPFRDFWPLHDKQVTTTTLTPPGGSIVAYDDGHFRSKTKQTLKPSLPTQTAQSVVTELIGWEIHDTTSSANYDRASSWKTEPLVSNVPTIVDIKASPQLKLNKSIVHSMRATKFTSSSCCMEQLFSTASVKNSWFITHALEKDKFLTIETSDIKTSMASKVSASASDVDVKEGVVKISENTISTAVFLVLLIPAAFLLMAYLMILALWLKYKLERTMRKDNMVVRDANTKRYEPVRQNLDPIIARIGPTENPYDPPPLIPFRETRVRDASQQNVTPDAIPYDPHCVLNPIYQRSTYTGDQTSNNPIFALSALEVELLKMVCSLDDKNDPHLYEETGSGLSVDFSNIYENMNEGGEDDIAPAVPNHEQRSPLQNDETMQNYL